ncbi:MAG TPA: AraC family transcriptional regulator [Clostridia bacterium]|nr:AraC family transcriptional regulator [Clostridia bacterium]
MQEYVHRYKTYVRNSVKARWVLSCLSLSLIPILLGLTIFFTNISSYKRQTVQNNEVMLLQVQNLMDQAFYDIKAIVQMISTEPSLNKFSTIRPENILLKRELKQRLAQYRGYSSYIQDIYIYFLDTDQVVSDTTTGTSRIMYYVFHKNEHFSYDEWMSIVRQPRIDQTIVLPTAKSETNMAYIKSLSLFSVANVNATVVVLISNDNIAKMARTVAQQASCEMNILLDDSRPVLPLSPGLAASAALFSRIDPREGVIERAETKEGLVLSLRASNTLDITYILGTPRSAYFSTLRYVNLLFLSGLFIVILGSVCFAVLFVWKNYAPIKEIMEIVLKPGASWQAGGCGDEYAVIKNAIVSSKNSSVEMQDRLNRQSSMLFRTMLALLLHHSAVNPAGAEQEALAHLRSHFKLEVFAVLLLSLDKHESPQNNLAFLESIRQLSAFLQVQSALRESDTSFWAIEIDSRIILLFNMSKGFSEKWADVALESGSALQAWWGQSCRGELLFTASGCYDGLENVSHAYEEADYFMKYRLVFGTNFQSQHGYAAIPALSGGYFYPPEEENKLFNIIASGDAEKAAEMFDALWKINLEKNLLPENFLYCLLFDILGTVIRACNLIAPVFPIKSNLVSAMEKLTAEKNLDKIRISIHVLMRDVCTAYSCEHPKSTDKLKKSILHYIDQHHCDQNLSVESIGDVFGKSRAYLFSLFKEDTGFSLLYHIGKVRIEHAKPLLRSRSHSIESIAGMVGFNSTISFTRTFKKYENITPGKYREIFLNSNE